MTIKEICPNETYRTFNWMKPQQLGIKILVEKDKRNHNDIIRNEIGFTYSRL